MTAKLFSLEVQPVLPKHLERLEELAEDLLYSWDRAVRRLFYRLDAELWQSVGHNPKVFLRRISQARLEEATNDLVFVQDYNRVLSVYDTYYAQKSRSSANYLDENRDLVAYFCAEFGLHESLPIYSGGLGILAGDHCKAASDLNVPFVAVGLLYRQGYFTQTIDAQGNQVAHYHPTDFDDLPISPAFDRQNNPVSVTIDLPERQVCLKVWLAKAGHIRLYLLDSDLPENSEEDRRITYQLYGGDINTRIQQEIALGIGGVRALRALGMQPTVWHINEGHAAFSILERVRERISRGIDFETALEVVASSTVFTTHTPVPAGHDIFDHKTMKAYFAMLIKEFGISMEEFLKLGASPSSQGGFNQTALSLRGSRFHNGVSEIHGQVASRMEGYIWPQIPHDENPVKHVTNGVHIGTFLSREWANLFDMRFGGGWRNRLRDRDFWRAIDEIPHHSYWSVRQSLKAKLFEDAYRRAVHQHRRNGLSQPQIELMTQHLAPQETEILTIGFARRFATYKRANLLFYDLERLARMVGNPERPVVFIFAGKAHPHDLPGQQLIQFINEVSRRPEFMGKIVLLEGYDLALGRRLVSGVDVWLNTPEYPMEASGTSGEKAGLNGVMNLSILDGWWGEGYDGENGWAISPHGHELDAEFRNRQEASELLSILENQVIPLYYQRDGYGYSEGWVAKSKASMRTLLPRFNAQRMVMDYVTGAYGPAAKRALTMRQDNCAPAQELAAWKQKVLKAWPNVRIRRMDEPTAVIKSGQSLPIEVGVYLDALNESDVIVECLVGILSEHGDFITHSCHRMDPAGRNSAGEAIFHLDFAATLPGLQHYKIRIFPYHRLLTHHFETGCMLWI